MRTPRKPRQARCYAVLVSVPDENFDSDSIYASAFYGPYTPDEAAAIVAQVGHHVDGACARKILLGRATSGRIVDLARKAVETSLAD